MSYQNVTDVKNTQQALEASKRLLEAILHNLVDGILTFDETGDIKSVNRAGAYIFGYAADELVGMNIRILIPSVANDASQKELKTLLDQVSGLGDELEGQRKDGSIFQMYFATSVVMLDHQKVYTAIIQDLTERKFMETQVWEKERLNIELEKRA